MRSFITEQLASRIVNEVLREMTTSDPGPIEPGVEGLDDSYNPFDDYNPYLNPTPQPPGWAEPPSDRSPRAPGDHDQHVRDKDRMDDAFRDLRDSIWELIKQDEEQRKGTGRQ